VRAATHVHVTFRAFAHLVTTGDRQTHGLTGERTESDVTHSYDRQTTKARDDSFSNPCSSRFVKLPQPGHFESLSRRRKLWRLHPLDARSLVQHTMRAKVAGWPQAGVTAATGNREVER
jgi:hypothetical protein